MELLMSVIIRFGMLPSYHPLVKTVHLVILCLSLDIIFFYRYLHLCLQTLSLELDWTIHFDFAGRPNSERLTFKTLI
jgi:hypothetical protein